MFCYANANLTREEQSGEITRFVEFWQQLVEQASSTKVFFNHALVSGVAGQT